MAKLGLRTRLRSAKRTSLIRVSMGPGREGRPHPWTCRGSGWFAVRGHPERQRGIAIVRIEKLVRGLYRGARAAHADPSLQRISTGRSAIPRLSARDDNELALGMTS